MFNFPMVCFDHVGLRYGHGPEILKDLSFVIEKGALAFLTGPSGAGKTSLLKLLFFALQPTRGLISVMGYDTSLLKRQDLLALRRHIGVVFQDFRLLDHLTVFENVALPLVVAGMAREVYRKNVQELLAWFGLSRFSEVYPAVLSGGEKQRVAIARSVVAKPSLLLADEPTGNVDPALAQKLFHLFEELNHSGTTVVIATHDQSLLSQRRDAQIIAL